MFKQSKLRTPRQQNGFLICSLLFTCIFLGITILFIDNKLQIGISKYSNALFIGSISFIFLNQLFIWFIRNKAYKGIKHAIYHYRLVLSLRKALLDARYYNVRFYLNTEVADLPNIKVSFTNNFSKATLSIENIKINKDFSDINISFALRNFIVEREFVSDNENFHVFEIYDSNIDNQFKFNSLEELQEYASKTDSYTLFIDKSTVVPLHGSLYVGMTGSGKTYALYSLVLQMMSKKIPYNIYFADPKNSSLAVLGEKISKENTATGIDDIIKLLQKFNNLMEERKIAIKSKLTTKLDATYADFLFEPHIFIFDEFASFQTVLQSMEKKKRDGVMKLLSQVVLQGRALGFFYYFIMQKSDATQLPTYLRENLPIKFVLGNAEKQTYITAFGTGVDIPDKNFTIGQGVFTCPNVANSPKICHFSYLNFDILAAINKLMM